MLRGNIWIFATRATVSTRVDPVPPVIAVNVRQRRLARGRFLLWTTQRSRSRPCRRFAPAAIGRST